MPSLPAEIVDAPSHFQEADDRGWRTKRGLRALMGLAK
jgi:hypothetical protein